MNFTPAGKEDVVEGYCVIKTIEKKNSSNGSVYLDMTLADNSGEINAKKWDFREEREPMFSRYDFVYVKGQIGEFRNTSQLKIFAIRKVGPEDDVNISDYVPSAILSGEVMLDEIRKTVDAFNDEELKKLVTAILDKYCDKLIYWPAAKALHHAVRGGILMHTLSILRMAKSVCDIYTYVNRDLLYSGIILHDICKIDEINSSETGVPGELSTRGNLLGHLVMGAMEIDRAGRELGISEEKLTLLEHMLISHHGIPEYGAAKYPMFVEAEVLSMLDDLDAKLYIFNSAVSGVEKGSFTNKIWSLENRPLYNHGIDNDGDVRLI